MSIASHAISPTLYDKLPFDAEKDFTPISMLWLVPNVLVVKPEIPATTIPELVALAKASPGKYTFASGGAGISMLHVPYRAGAAGPARGQRRFDVGQHSGAARAHEDRPAANARRDVDRAQSDSA